MKIKIVLLALLFGCGGTGTKEDNFAEENSSGQCSIQPGEYSANYSVVTDTCGIGPLPSELLIIGSGGTVIGSAEPPLGCFDSGFIVDGCSAAFSRDCTYPAENGGTIESEIHFAYSFGSNVGSIRGSFNLVSGGQVLDTCGLYQTVSIEKI